MQPYFFPYVGYLQLVNAVDKFVFYDDVHFIKKGWINRNRILLNGKAHFITVPCLGISQNKLINEICVDTSDKKFSSLTKTIALCYRGAPFFNEVSLLIGDVLENSDKRISEIAARSVEATFSYLGIIKSFARSSIQHPQTRALDKEDRLIAICKYEGISEYVNAAGGQTLYDKKYFNENGVNLSFIFPDANIRYEQQRTQEFVPHLSTIDLLMYCSKDRIREILNQYKLE